MTSQTMTELISKTCTPCEGNVPAYTLAEAREQLVNLDGWQLTHGGKRIRKDWLVKDFMAGVYFLDRIADLAESESHHPDLHLESYRNVGIELWTHAIGGLSENDFILAAKIDRLPVALKR